MKSEQFRNIQNMIRNNENFETLSHTLIQYSEDLYLRYWITNLELDMVSFLESYGDVKIMKESDSIIDQALCDFMKLLQNPEKLFSLTDKESTLVALKQYRKEMEKRVKVLAAYSDMARIYEYLINRRENAFEEKISELESDEAFSGRLLQFLFSDEDAVVINDKIKQTYGQLPIRMTINRFNNHIDTALSRLRGVPAKDLDRHIDSIKEAFKPESVDGYGVYFLNIVQLIQEISHITDPNLTAMDYVTIKDSFEGFLIHINMTISFVLDMVQIVNELLGLASVINENSINACSLQIEHFAKVSGLVSNMEVGIEENDEIFQCLSQLEGILEEITTELGQCEVMVENFTKTKMELLQDNHLVERYNTLLALSRLTSGSFFSDMSGLKKENEEVVDNAYLAISKMKLSLFFESVAKGENKLMIRARMALTFSVLNIIHTSPQEVYDFILDAIKSCKDKGEKDICFKLIIQLMQSY